MVIQFGGFATSGKDTAGEILKELSFEHEAFAKPLKEMALAINPLIPVNPYQEESGFVPSKFNLIRLADLVEQQGWGEAKNNEEVRRFLQATGTEGVRGCLGEDTWRDALLRRIELNGFKSTYITDTRFPNEIIRPEQVGGMVTFFFWIVRPEVKPARGHVSEQDLSMYADQILFNTGTVAELHAKVLFTLRSRVGLSIPEHYDHPPLRC